MFILVNAETSARSPDDRSADVPGTLRAALALADIPINRNSDSALTQMRGTVEAWATEVRAARARGDTEVFAADAQFYLIEATLAAEPDAEKREALQRIPTSLELPADDVALLRAHARAALQRSTEHQRLLKDLRYFWTRSGRGCESLVSAITCFCFIAAKDCILTKVA